MAEFIIAIFGTAIYLICFTLFWVAVLVAAGIIIIVSFYALFLIIPAAIVWYICYVLWTFYKHFFLVNSSRNSTASPST